MQRPALLRVAGASLYEAGQRQPLRLQLSAPAYAALLAGSWRREAPLIVDAAELRPAVPWLLRGGVAPLVWWRLRHRADIAETARPLRDACRHTALLAALQERHIVQAFEILRGAGVEPLLGKGWAAARLYGNPALRPYGDVDLFVAPGDALAAGKALRSAEGEACGVDLHVGGGDLDDRSWTALLARSREEFLDGARVRIFGAEDHLRLLALHALRHGLRRPLWLCDIAAALENATEGFEWSYALGSGSRRDAAVREACLLAADTLGAIPGSGVPAGERPRGADWLRRALRREWDHGTLLPQGTRLPFGIRTRGLAAAWHALRERWPNPIEATVAVGGPMTGLPRWPFQIAEVVRRSMRFACRPRLFDEAIPEADHRLHVIPRVAELGPQAAHVGVDAAGVDLGVETPDPLQQAVPRDRAPGALH
jgi:hypothetical protein